MLTVLLLLAMSAQGQAPPDTKLPHLSWPSQAAPSLPLTGHFDCYRDSATHHFTCISAKGSTLDVEDALSKLDARAADEIDGKPSKCYKRPAGDGCNIETVCGDSVSVTAMYCGPVSNLIPKPADPIDVPAVQETITYEVGTDSCKAAPECKDRPSCNIVICTRDTATRKITTCADKTRGLWHDESTPPKYWCHQVQP